MRIFDEKTMMRINDLRAVLRRKFHNKKRLFLRDTSGPNSAGYSLDLVLQKYEMVDYHNEDGSIAVSDWEWNDVKILAKSKDTFLPNSRNKIGGLGAYAPTFDRADIGGVNER